MTEILETARLLLRPVTLADNEAFTPVLSCPEVMQYSMTGAMDKDQIMASISSWIASYQQYGFGPWAIIHAGKLIGYAGLDVRIVEEQERTQITFRLAKEYWGKGIATEVATAVRDYAFQHLGKKEIIAIVDPENTASIRTITKIGMVFEKNVSYGGLPLSVYKIEQNIPQCTTSLAHAICASQNFFFRHMAAQIFERDGILATTMGIDNPFLNSVLHTELSSDALTSLIPEVVTFFKEYNVPWTWQVNPFTAPPQLGTMLESYGMKELENFDVMAMDLNGASPSLPLGTVSIREVRQRLDFDDWGIPQKEGFESTAAEAVQFRALTERIPYGEGHDFHHYTLYKGNAPLASATLSLHQGNARLDNIAVRTTQQQQGYGTLITQHLLKEAQRLGAKQCFLDASAQGNGLYRKLGFISCYTGRLYTHG